MSKGKDAWWVCNTCNKPVVKTGAKSVKETKLQHRTVCYEIATFSIKQIEQGPSK